MAGVKINVQSKALEQRIASLLAAADRRRKFFDSVGRKLRTLVLQGFKASRDPWGIPWAPLKSRKGQPLIDTGRLRASITYRATDEHVDVGTNVKYARIHQFGGKRGSSNQVLAFGSSGRFISRAAAGRRRRGSIRIAFARTGGGTIPARPFLPLDQQGNANLPPAWQQAVLGIARAQLAKAAEGVTA